MAKDTNRDQDHPEAVRRPGQHGTPADAATATAAGGAGANTGGSSGAADAAGGQHHAAKAHGRPAKVDESLPATRAELLARHTDARRRRNTAPLGSDDFRAAVDEIGRIEIRIAALDRAADPPLG